MNLRHQPARVEIARHENARNAIVWNTECWVLSIAEQECMSRQERAPDLQPNQVIADFEEAPTAAIRAVYGNDLTVSGCWFHYGQAIMKRLKKIGLTEAYQNEETTQAVLRCLLALPVTDIDPAFQDVKVLVHDDTPSKTLLLQLCRYVERQWLNKSSIGAARMSVRGNPARTNNAVESFHSAL